MSTKPQSTDEELSKKEENLLTVAKTDMQSAEFAKIILREKFGYDEEDLP